MPSPTTANSLQRFSGSTVGPWSDAAPSLSPLPHNRSPTSSRPTTSSTECGVVDAQPQQHHVGVNAMTPPCVDAPTDAMEVRSLQEQKMQLLSDVTELTVVKKQLEQAIAQLQSEVFTSVEAVESAEDQLLQRYHRFSQTMQFVDSEWALRSSSLITRIALIEEHVNAM